MTHRCYGKSPGHPALWGGEGGFATPATHRPPAVLGHSVHSSPAILPTASASAEEKEGESLGNPHGLGC